jgi:predicted dithiol-disulfide oxidoreductase (DUF899 family)
LQGGYADQQIFKTYFYPLSLLLAFDATCHSCEFQCDRVDGHIAYESLDESVASITLFLGLPHDRHRGSIRQR